MLQALQMIPVLLKFCQSLFGCLFIYIIKWFFSLCIYSCFFLFFVWHYSKGIFQFFLLLVIVLFIVFDYTSACGILVPQPGIRPTQTALEAQSLNCWTAWKSHYFLNRHLIILQPIDLLLVLFITPLMLVLQVACYFTHFCAVKKKLCP